MLAPIRHDQAERLAAIRRYDLGTHAHEGTFDGLVALAAQVADCPIAMVSIVHEDRQQFEGYVGIDAATAQAAGALEASICSHAIVQGDVLEIPDLRRDARTADNPT